MSGCCCCCHSDDTAARPAVSTLLWRRRSFTLQALPFCAIIPAFYKALQSSISAVSGGVEPRYSNVLSRFYVRLLTAVVIVELQRATGVLVSREFAKRGVSISATARCVWEHLTRSALFFVAWSVIKRRARRLDVFDASFSQWMAEEGVAFSWPTAWKSLPSGRATTVSDRTRSAETYLFRLWSTSAFAVLAFPRF